MSLKTAVKPKGHYINSRRTEIAVGLLLFVVGCFLLWDAFDNRGRKMPWPAGGLAPW
jgi:hypothetical protein